MSPTNQSCAQQLRHMIYYSLDNNILDNALFLAGRLLAYEPKSLEAVYLASLINLRLLRYKIAYESSRFGAARGGHLGCAYVFAQACLSLAKYQEGIDALMRVRGLWKGKNNWAKHTDSRRQTLPDAAAVYLLLGQLHRANKNSNPAAECFSECLKMNPFMWDAFSALCDTGTTPRTSAIFMMNQDMMSVMEGVDETSGLEEMIQTLTNGDPFSIQINRANELRQAGGKGTLTVKRNGIATNGPITIMSDGFETPTNGYMAAPEVKEINLDADNLEPPQAPLRRNRTVLGAGSADPGVQAPPRMKAAIPKFRKLAIESDDGDSAGFGGITDRKRTVSGHAAQSSSSSGSTMSSTQHLSDPMAPMARRSVRILNSATTRPSSRLAGTTSSIPPRDVRDPKKVRTAATKPLRATTATVGRVVSGNRKHEPVDLDVKEVKPVTTTQPTRAMPVTSEKPKDVEGVYALLELFRHLADGYLTLSRHNLQSAIKIFNSLPPAQKDTPWVLSQLGRAYFEQASWGEAEKVYSHMRRIAPARVDDLELYSTVLWHQKRDVELSFLAHEIMDLDRISPQAWCILGNSLSLQRDHEGALKCFKRATQLDPGFAYAFTLQGHEYIAGEEYDKALNSYRSAVAAETRHYNAWYGLGKVYEKQGKYEMAETHYRVAHGINPTNAILVCCIGVVLEKMKKVGPALDYYTKATQLAPKSTLARYKKARALMGIGHTQTALEELLVLKDIAPEEANVHFLLGKVYKSLHDKGNAVKHFTSALNLDPKASQHIKEAMEQMEDELDEDDLMT